MSFSVFYPKRDHFHLLFILSTLPFLVGFKQIGRINSFGDKIKVEKVLADQGVIWGFDFIGQNQIIFTERSGAIKLFDLRDQKVTVLSGVPKSADVGQGGMLDIRLHPQFAENREVFFTYSVEQGGKYSTRLSKATLDSSGKKLINLKVLFTAQPFFSQTHHFGSRVVFDGKGHLFLSVGDRGNRDLAQDLKTHNGKILRLDLNGVAPKTNPFTNLKGALPEIWSLGHRNPQGLFYEKQTDTLWEQEHGPRGGDEINKVLPGKNYGWPIITYGREYTGPKIGQGTEKVGMEQPLKYYIPSIAPSGLVVYSGKLMKKWQGHILSGALKSTHINQLYQDKKNQWQEKKMLKGLGRRIRNLGEDSNGNLYASTDSGEILRLSL
jgi:glucose/arabinose dehydrogenase